jgi:hypothetical protein
MSPVVQEGTEDTAQQQPAHEQVPPPTAAAASAETIDSSTNSEPHECWTNSYIPLPVVDEEETVKKGHEVLVDINFAELIGVGSRTAKNDESKRRYLSTKYSYNSADFRKHQLAPLFQQACKKAGFEVIMKGWEEHRQMIRFACQRSRLYKSKASNDSNGNTQRKISRPTTQKCPFNFSVFWEKGPRIGVGRWYVCSCGMGKNKHEGHSPTPWKEDPEQLSPHDVAFQQFLPQYQQFCLLAASGDVYQMDYAGKLLQESIYKLQAKAPPKKRKRGRKPKFNKDEQFSSLQGMSFPAASLPASSVPPKSAPLNPKAAPKKADDDKKMPAATKITGTAKV